MKNNQAVRSVPGQVVLGLVVIGLGVLFLLDNLNILNFHRAIGFWPAILIVIGVIKLLDTRSPNGYLVGVLFIGAGSVLTLNRMGLFNFDWRMFWPVLLIILGLSVVFKALAGRRQRAGDIKLADSSDAVIEVTAILGGFERRVTSPDFRGGEVTAVMGGCSLDLRACALHGEAVINVFAAMGGITLKCPPDWTVILQGTPIMGGFEEKTVRPPDDSKRLIVRGYAIMGAVDVRN